MMNTPEKRYAIRPCTVTWLILIAFTVVTWFAGESGMSGPGMVAMVMGIAFVKGQMVADRFMALRGVIGKWRWPVTIWLVVVCSLIGVAYWLGLKG